jgi:nucleotide-binding universal stress UspA family protein
VDKYTNGNRAEISPVRKGTRQMYKKIMVPLDGSKLAECVFPHLDTILKGCYPTEVLFVQVVDPIAIPYGTETTKIKSIEDLKTFESHNKSDAEKYLKGIVDRYKQSGINAKGEVLFGKATEALKNFALKNGVDLVIIATHGRSGVSQLVWGSVAESLLRSLCLPVLMSRAPGCGLTE